MPYDWTAKLKSINAQQASQHRILSCVPFAELCWSPSWRSYAPSVAESHPRHPNRTLPIGKSCNKLQINKFPRFLQGSLLLSFQHNPIANKANVNRNLKWLTAVLTHNLRWPGPDSHPEAVTAEAGHPWPHWRWSEVARGSYRPRNATGRDAAPSDRSPGVLHSRIVLRPSRRFHRAACVRCIEGC